MVNTVLFVDNDKIALALAEIIIKKTGFAKEFITAENGKEAIKWLSDYFSNNNMSDGNTPPDLIFLDINMPIMDGWDFLECYIKDYSYRLPTTKVVVLSSFLNPGDVLRAKKYKIVISLLDKPLTMEAIKVLSDSCFSKAIL